MSIYTTFKFYAIKGLKNGKSINELSLYEAVKLLLKIAKDDPGQITDATHIDHRDRYVAFLSGWTTAITPMWQAADDERYLIDTWGFALDPKLRDERTASAV